MKINITKETLLEGIQVISAGSSSRTTLPILHNFLIETQENKLKLVRTDMEMATVHYIPAEIEEEGSLTVPMKEFSDIIDSDIYDAISMEACVNGRNITGVPAEETVKNAIKIAEKYIEKL